MDMTRLFLTAAAALLLASSAAAERVVPIKFGNMDQWVTRNIKESAVIGGKEKHVYAIGPTQTITGAKPYVPQGGSPWASSNVYAKVFGVVKTSNAVFPAPHPGHGTCARLSTMLEHCKVLGLMNIDVLVSGSIFLGQMQEPIANTSNPYSKFDMGIPFTQRPKALVFDYKLIDPQTNIITRATTGSRKTRKGKDSADVYIYLQRRWEDAEGNVHAKRVGTGRERFSDNHDWVYGHRIPVIYGDATKHPSYRNYMNLLNGEKAYYTRNSKGKMVPINEEGWDDENATPTHLIVMFSAGSGVAYEGQLGMELWVDNVALAY